MREIVRMFRQDKEFQLANGSVVLVSWFRHDVLTLDVSATFLLDYSKTRLITEPILGTLLILAR